MKFEWDDQKDAINQCKHGISFQEACEIFENPVLTKIDDRYDYGEIREISYGIIADLIVIVVVHTDIGQIERTAQSVPFLREKPNKSKGNYSMSISKERLAEIAAIDDEDIDTSDIPEASERFFQTARLIVPASSVPKKSISMRIDEDILEWFKSEGKGHLSRMNAVLRAYMMSHNTGKQ